MPRRRSTTTSTESTPLLQEVRPEPIDDGAVEQQRAAQDAEVAEEETLIGQEVKGKKLVLILGSVYLGVFLGALGMHKVDLIRSWCLLIVCRFDYHRDTRHAHIRFVPLFHIGVMDSDSISYRQCSFAAAEWQAHRYLWETSRTCLVKHLLPCWQLDLWSCEGAMGHDPWKSSRWHGWWRFDGYLDVRRI